MQNSHDRIRQLAQENTETAIERNIKDHDNKAFPRFFKVGDMVLIQVKNFLGKNQKLAENYKGPYIITKMNNNTATIKMPHGTKEYNYNTQMFKLIHQGKVQKNNLPQTPRKKRRKEKNNYPGIEE